MVAVDDCIDDDNVDDDHVDDDHVDDGIDVAPTFVGRSTSCRSIQGIHPCRSRKDYQYQYLVAPAMVPNKEYPVFRTAAGSCSSYSSYRLSLSILFEPANTSTHKHMCVVECSPTPHLRLSLSLALSRALLAVAVWIVAKIRIPPASNGVCFSWSTVGLTPNRVDCSLYLIRKPLNKKRKFIQTNT